MRSRSDRPIHPAHRLSPLAVALLLLAVFLASSDGGRFWLDDCHYTPVSHCADEGTTPDLCDTVQALVTVASVSTDLLPALPAPQSVATPPRAASPRSVPWLQAPPEQAAATAPLGPRAPPAYSDS